MFEANRWAWNIVIEKAGDKLYEKGLEIKKSVREFVKKKNISDELSIKNAPEECFDSAYRDVFKARDANAAKAKSQKTSTGKGYQLKNLRFKSKKDVSQSIEIRARSIKTESKSVSFFPKFFEKKGKIKIKAKLPKIKYSCRLQKTNSKFFLIIPIDKLCRKSNAKSVCSIDPGIRTMLTLYDPEGRIIEIGTNPEWITKKQNSISALQSKLSKEKNSRKKQTMKKQINNTYQKIKNRILDAHHKISKWISENYKKVLLPVFESKKILKNSNILKKQSKHQLMTWSHYKFKELLRYKMKIKGGKLIDCTEEYTSKTCSNCGRLNHNLKGSKTFHCKFSECGIEIDRDVNGARNIFIKNHKLLFT